MWEFLEILAANPVFAGIAGGAGVSAILYQARALPTGLGKWILRQSTVSLVLDNSDDLFERVAIYFSTSPDVGKSRWLRMVELYDDEEQKWIWRASFGPGWHLLRDRGRWFLFHRALEEKSTGLSLKRRETLTIRTLGRSQSALVGLMKRAEEVYETSETLRVYLWHEGRYIMADRKPKRGIETIFLPDEQVQRIIGDLDRWRGAKAEYRRRGVPYRRGYLLEGPPGTGKTSLAMAMASHAARPIYLINLSTAGGDTGLQAAFNQIESGAVVVIEDVDSAKITHERDTAADAAENSSLDPAKAVTLSGLLNAVDGLGSRENRILIITSNRADVLDAALIRPGRIDLREHVGLMGEQEARAMCAAYRGQDAEFYDRKVAHLLPIAPAALQGMLLSEGAPA